MELQRRSMSEAFRQLLQNEFEARCAKNSRYSLRAFARSLEVDASTLRKFMIGDRVITEKSRSKLASKLNLSADQRLKFGMLSSPEKVADFSDFDTTLSVDQYSVCSEWYYFALIELTRTEDFQSEPKWIAKKLGLNPSQVAVAVDRLVRLKLLFRDGKGNLSANGKNICLPMNNPMTTDAQKNRQVQCLEKAQEAVKNVPKVERKNSGLTIAIEKNNVHLAQQAINQFISTMNDLMQPEEGAKADSVYQLNVAFFPLTDTTESNL